MPRLHREPGIAHGAHVVEQMEAKPDVSDVFAPVPVEIEVSNFRLPESILHGRINHSISTGRRDIEFIPASQSRGVPQRKAFIQRRISGNRSGQKRQEQSVFVVCQHICGINEVPLINVITIEFAIAVMKLVTGFDRVLYTVRFGPDIVKHNGCDSRAGVCAVNLRILQLQLRKARRRQ